MITQLGGRPSMFGGADDSWWSLCLKCVLSAIVVVTVYHLLRMSGLLEPFMGAPNTYNHIAWQGDGIQSAAFNLLRPWDVKPRDDKVYGIDKKEAEKRAKIMKTSLSS